MHRDYATGQALCVLRTDELCATEEAYRRGAAYLLRTSWAAIALTNALCQGIATPAASQAARRCV